jgi:hypothetical protein
MTTTPLDHHHRPTSRRRRRLHRPVVAFAAAVGILGLTGCDPGPGYKGVCTGADALTGVTIVIDFQGLDGNDGRPAETITRCSPNPNPGTDRTGIQALQDAGIDVTGVNQWGLGFVCRLAARPAIDEPLPVEGDPGYTEACVATPPAAAYWSYWHAPGTGHSWIYSSFGALNRKVVPGGFEGWSFSLNAGPTANPVPGVDPYNPAADPTAPRVTLAVSDVDATIRLGQSTQLAWTSTNAVSLATATGPGAGGGTWSGALTPLNGSRTITPTARGAYTYLLQATSPTGQTAITSATLTVE